MNNEQFRNLLLQNSRKQDGDTSTSRSDRPSTTSALGSRKRTSLPMTPRQLGTGRSSSTGFTRQLAERNGKPDPSSKKFKSSAPKGVKLAAGFRDRTKDREEERELTEVEKRVMALAQALKEEEIDQETFERQVQEITGGDIAATHLVKGLDRKLLEKVKRGETVLPDDSAAFANNNNNNDEGSDVEDEFDQLASQTVAPVARQKSEKLGEKAPPPKVAGVKRSRNDILAELKAQRKAAAEAAERERQMKYPSLPSAFQKVGPGGETSRIEIDAKGREVLIITDAEGKEKRKVRKQKTGDETLPERRFDLEDTNKPLPAAAEALIAQHNQDGKLDGEGEEAKQEAENEDSDDDIFTGVGSSYNPLADLDSGSDSEEAPEPDEKKPAPAAPPATTENISATPQATQNPAVPAPRKNYFTTKPPTSTPQEKDSVDATVLAALRKARTLDATSTLLQDTPEARLAKRAAELAAADRDMEDMDMGFGVSRFDDAEEMEMEGEKVKFSQWKGLGADEDEDEVDGKGGGPKKRKRGPKKKKGDKNNVADVLHVMERQKKAKTLG
ncbi:hypothetical protein M011DRAFT_472037 [Sporormia fimetaria CBS 119925]|uniref:RED-like N-terminal domain-containing protein n=1 Tax=Sporormia fimetaria CBS 119925 TaxID=1340428 RepID=A0A6A6UYB6_9PLEO|nr:hypothetical protein M011DRAFT_472037 [Sporormia fimetaria CBS 119925]